MAVLLSPVGGVAAQFFTNAGVPLSGGKFYTYAAGTSTPQATYTTGAGNIQHSNPIVLDAAGRVPTGEIWLTDGSSYKFVLKDANDVLIATYDNIVGINSNFVNFVNQQEIQTATAGQTVFTLTTMEYQPGIGNLSVFVDGVNQYGPGAQYAYTETSSTVVTFVSGLHVGASVKFTTTEIQNSGVADASQITYTYPDANAVQESVEERLAQYVSVKDFGAVGDGVADDTDAMNAAHATGKVIYYPSGTYLFTTLDPIVSGGIKGDGRGYTTLESTDTGSDDLITFTGNSFSPLLQDFLLKAPMSANLPVKTGGAGIVFDATSGEIGYGYFCNVTIAFVPTCVKFVEASYWMIDNCEFLGYDTAGLDIANANNPDSGDSVVTGSLFNTPGTTGYGIVHRSSGGLKIVANKFLGGSVGYSLQFNGTDNTSILLFTGNSVENMTNQCMAFARTSGSSNFSNVVITGNEFAVGPTGIQDDASSFINEFVISGNVFNLASGSGYGISLNTITDFAITGNTFKGNGGTPSAIVIGASCFNGKIASDNVYSTIGTITNNSTSTIVEKSVQSGSATTSSSSWTSYGALYSSPTVSVTFPTPYVVAPSAGDIQLTAASTNGAVSGIVTTISTTGFTFVGLSVTSNVAAVFYWKASGIV